MVVAMERHGKIHWLLWASLSLWGCPGSGTSGPGQTDASTMDAAPAQDADAPDEGDAAVDVMDAGHSAEDSGAAANDAGDTSPDAGTTTSTACANGRLDPGETDVDCGGEECDPCEACENCLVSNDCQSGDCVDNQCQYSTGEVYVDWQTNCSSSDANRASWLTVPDVPAGYYTIEALESAGSFWDNPPGWLYLLTCPAFDADENLVRYQLHSPGDFEPQPTATAAYQLLITTTGTHTWGGGDLECGVVDAECGDNLGGIRFQMDLHCDGAPTD